jgi:hypothetical protein
MGDVVPMGRCPMLGCLALSGRAARVCAIRAIIKGEAEPRINGPEDRST